MAYRITPRAAHLRACLANATLRGDVEDAQRLRVELAEAMFESKLLNLIADAPPLTAEQAAKHAAVLLRIPRATDTEPDAEAVLSDV